METEQIILIIVSVHLFIRLVSNYGMSGELDKSKTLLFAYLENNERDRLKLINETIPNIEDQLYEIRRNTD